MSLVLVVEYRAGYGFQGGLPEKEFPKCVFYGIDKPVVSDAAEQPQMRTLIWLILTGLAAAESLIVRGVIKIGTG